MLCSPHGPIGTSRPPATNRLVEVRAPVRPNPQEQEFDPLRTWLGGNTRAWWRQGLETSQHMHPRVRESFLGFEVNIWKRTATNFNQSSFFLVGGTVTWVTIPYYVWFFRNQPGLINVDQFIPWNFRAFKVGMFHVRSFALENSVKLIQAARCLTYAGDLIHDETVAIAEISRVCYIAPGQSIYQCDIDGSCRHIEKILSNLTGRICMDKDKPDMCHVTAMF